MQLIKLKILIQILICFVDKDIKSHTNLRNPRESGTLGLRPSNEVAIIRIKSLSKW